jgi:hypothetical protein
VIVLVVLSLAIYVIWALNLAAGAFSEGILVPDTSTGLPIFHLTAEFLMVTVTLIGAVGLCTGTRWGRGVTLVGLGMFTYAAINALGWAVVNDPVQGIPMVLTVVLAVFAVPHLIRREGGSA